jgi:ABC-type glycerol-3-phosphate transport system permease component
MLIMFILFALYAASIIYMLFWGTMSSLKDGVEEYFKSPFALPEKLIFENYSEAVKVMSVNDVSFFTMTFNSTWFSVGSILINITFVSITAYIFAKYQFRFKRFLYALSLFIMMMPIYGAMPAQYSLYTMLGIIDSPMILLTHLSVFGSTSFIIVHGFYKNLSWAYAESAMIDGAGDWTIYFKIMLPQARSILASFMLINFIGNWNDYMTPILFLQNMPTLASGLFTYQTIVERTGNYPLFFAGIILSMLPIMVIYSMMHKTLIENMSFGGLKG